MKDAEDILNDISSGEDSDNSSLDDIDIDGVKPKEEKKDAPKVEEKKEETKKPEAHPHINSSSSDEPAAAQTKNGINEEELKRILDESSSDGHSSISSESDNNSEESAKIINEEDTKELENRQRPILDQLNTYEHENRLNLHKKDSKDCKEALTILNSQSSINLKVEDLLNIRKLNAEVYKEGDRSVPLSISASKDMLFIGYSNGTVKYFSGQDQCSIIPSSSDIKDPKKGVCYIDYHEYFKYAAIGYQNGNILIYDVSKKK